MASSGKTKTYRHRSLFSRVLCCLLVIALAAGICAWGCCLIILKGPFESYRLPFVRQLSEKRLGFVAERILGEEAVAEMLGTAVPSEEEAPK